MLLLLSFVVSFSSNELNEIFRKGREICKLNQPQITDSRAKLLVEQFNLKDIKNLLNFERCYKELSQKYEGVYDLDETLADLRQFSRFCDYIYEALDKPIPSWLKETLKKLEDFKMDELLNLKHDNNNFSEPQSHQTLLISNSLIFISMTIEKFKIFSYNKLKLIAESKNKFKQWADSINIPYRLSDINFKPLDDDKTLLEKLTLELRILYQTQAKLENIKREFHITLSLNKGEALYKEFKKEKDKVSDSNIYHKKNKYLDLLKLESELKNSEYEKLKKKLVEYVAELNKKFDSWSEKLPEGSLKIYESQFNPFVEKFTQKVPEIIEERNDLMTELENIYLPDKNLSFTQSLKDYINGGKYKKFLSKYNDIKNRDLELQASLEDWIEEYKSYKKDVPNISKVHSKTLENIFEAKTQPIISQLIDNDLVVLINNNHFANIPTKFRLLLFNCLKNLTNIKDDMEKTRRLYILILGGGIVLILLAVIFVVYIFKEGLV